MITLDGLTKRYGATAAVRDLTLTVEPGLVTGFLGPNGAGKSTTMRMILGLDRPTEGTALVAGRHYAEFRHPLREVGSLLDAKALHPGRSGRNHLLAMARSNGIPRARVDEVMEMVGLADVGGRRAGTYSLGMGQRLGIAGALLGDPGVLMFDEPVNGLDPDGVRWVRELMRSLAAGLAARDEGATADLAGPGELLISGMPVEVVGDLAHRLGVPLHELSPQEATLEQAYMELTADSVEYAAPQMEGAR